MGYQAAPNVHLYPSHGLGPLWLFLLVTKQAAWLPGSRPAHPPTITLPFICDTHDITAGKFSKASQYSAILTSYQLCSCNASYKLDWCCSGANLAWLQSSLS